MPFFERLPGLFPASGGGHRLLERLQVLAVVVHGGQHAALVLGLGGGVARVVDLERAKLHFEKRRKSRRFLNYFFPGEIRELAPQGVEDGVPRANVPLLDQGHVNVGVLAAEKKEIFFWEMVCFHGLITPGSP